MKKIACNVGLLIALASQAQTPTCYSGWRSTGGAIVLVTVSTNTQNGTSIVLPVGVQMCGEVTNNPLWSVSFTNIFGSNVTVLPRLNVKVTPGYISFYRSSPGAFWSVYSFDYPVYIQSTTDSNNWVDDFYFTLFGMRSWVEMCGPCQILNTDDHLGLVSATLYSGSNSNGLDGWTGSTEITNSLMRRFGLGACNAKVDDSNSRSAVSFIYFNLPPRKNIRVGYVCQDGTEFIQNYPPYNSPSWCGYSTNYEPGFIFSENVDCIQNWANYPAPCRNSTSSNRIYRIRYNGSTNCDRAPPAILPVLHIGANGASVLLSFQSVLGYTYQIYYTSNVNICSNWFPLNSAISGNNTIITVTDAIVTDKRCYIVCYQ